MRFSTVMFFVLAAVASARAGAPPAGFELRDQFGTRHQLSFPRDRISVLAFADRAGSEQLEGWVRPLYERYRDTIDIRGVAKLAGVPAPLRPVLRAIFRRALEYPVMMDWTGRVSEDYAYEARRVNLMVINPAGRIEYRFNGAATPTELQQCFERIDGLLGSSAPRAE
jgi:hypothetical protein